MSRPSRPIAALSIEVPEPIDPLADLLFTLTAILLLALAALLPAVVLSRAPPQTSPREIGALQFTLQGQSVRPFLAHSRGLRAADVDIPLAEISASRILSLRLDEMRRVAEPMVLLVSPDGLEAAFAFEALAGARGMGSLSQLRLDVGCRLGAVRLDCGRESSQVPP